MPAPEAPKTLLEEQPIRMKSWSGKRSIAAVLLIIFVGSGATYALTPAHTRDWWWASWQDDAQAYQQYIENYEKEGAANPHLEKAYLLRAERTERLTDLRAYQQTFRNGRYAARINALVRRRESADLQKIQQSPDTTNVRRFLKDFPESDNFDALKKVVNNRSELRKELSDEIETAHLNAIKNNATAQKIETYLREYPESTRLSELAEAASRYPEVYKDVKSRIETQILQQVERAKTVEELKPIMSTVRKIGDTTTTRKVEELIQKKTLRVKSALRERE